MKFVSSAILALFLLTIPAFAGVTVNSPSNGDTVSSPFNLSASSATCSSQSVSSMSYSLDSGTDLSTVNGQSMDVAITSGAGAHTVHVKAFGQQGAVCVTDVEVNVAAAADASASSDVFSDSSLVPSNAVSNSNIQALGHWNAQHDSGTSGSSSGTTTLVGSPSHGGVTREFATDFHSAAGERYSVSFADNQSATNFLYDAWVYIKGSASHIANIEMDLNQTMPNGDTVIFGVQCDGNNGRWDYTENLGTAHHPEGHWAASSAACNPRSWSTDQWHHVQISYSRDSTGHVTYKSVYFDGVKHTINRTAFAARALGWGSSLSTNFQIDGNSRGTATLYVDSLTISRW